jgi:polyisoprenyl-teichoic acid--peptidoglycan teichoic acid transferase
MRDSRFFHLTLTLLLSLLLISTAAAQDATPTSEPIPEPMPLVDEGGQDIIHILLIGAATTNPDNPGLTDSLMVVSVNRSAGAVSVVSIPRDLYVYVPGFGMKKINTAYYYAETQLGEGQGFPVLIDTVEYNLGLEIDFHARVDFSGFTEIIDAVGGIDITVDCVIRDWRLISPELDKQVAENYEMFTLGIGRWRMDGDLALWYVRSRKTSSDLDRGRRQQDVLRALWRKLRAEGVFEHLPQTWAALTDSVVTDMTLADVVGMAPMAATIETSDIQYYRFRQRHEVRNAVSSEGQAVLMPQREAIISLMQEVVLPPNFNQIQTELPTVALVNAGGVPNMEYVAADRLELEGFRTVVIEEPNTQFRNYNHIVDYTGALKDNPVESIMDVLGVTAEGVAEEPDPNRAYDFKVYIGEGYQYWACTRDVIQPSVEQMAAEATASAGGP